VKKKNVKRKKAVQPVDPMRVIFMIRGNGSGRRWRHSSLYRSILGVLYTPREMCVHACSGFHTSPVPACEHERRSRGKLMWVRHSRVVRTFSRSS